MYFAINNACDTAHNGLFFSVVTVFYGRYEIHGHHGDATLFNRTSQLEDSTHLWGKIINMYLILLSLII